MGLELACWREFSKLVTHHVFSDVNGNMSFPIVNAEGVTNELRRNGASARPGLDDSLLTRSFHHLNLLQELRVNVDTFF